MKNKKTKTQNTNFFFDDQNIEELLYKDVIQRGKTPVDIIDRMFFLGYHNLNEEEQDLIKSIWFSKNLN